MVSNTLDKSDSSTVIVEKPNFLTNDTDTLAPEYKLLDAYWRASNYLAVGQIYLLQDNPLLRKPLELDHIKKRLLGHFGTTPGQNFIYVHLNRLIRERDLSIIYVSGPGHGGPAVLAQVYMEGVYSEIYPAITENIEGMGQFFRQFSFPGGIPSHVAPETPGSMHEGGELGYSLSHSFGAVLDKPDLIVACVVGDGEAETGPLAASWHSNKFLNPVTDGVVLPILHLNGYKIANPAILNRIPEHELKALFVGYGYEPIIVEGSDPATMHPAFANALDTAADKIQEIRKKAKKEVEQGLRPSRPTWPMIILKTPKGWTGPKIVDGLGVENTHRSHQVPVSNPATNPSHLKTLEDWLKSYHPEDLFDEHGALLPELKALAPRKGRRMGENPYTNPIGETLVLPDFTDYGIDIDPTKRGQTEASDTYTLGTFLKGVIEKNETSKNFRIFGPDETKSNRLHAVYEATSSQWNGEYFKEDDEDGTLAPTGRVMEILSEHTCEGWLEGYLLTGGHGLLNSYEAFIHLISSMFNQHAKWLEACNKIPWRNNISSLNILLASHVWRQDHNGFTHQDPGFLQHVVTKKPEVTRIYLPPDANCLLSVMSHCLASHQYVNVVVAGKHPSPQWLTIEEAREHCTNGLGIWEWASNDKGREPDVVIAAAGDVPTMEALAAVSILRKELPNLIVRFVNVVDILKLNTPEDHPHGLSHAEFDSIFTQHKPVLFNFHAYPQMVEKLLFDRTNRNFKVKGYMEEGTITTPFDMCVLNGVDRYTLVMDVCDMIEKVGNQEDCHNRNTHSLSSSSSPQKNKTLDEGTRWKAAYTRQEMKKTLVAHHRFIEENGRDTDEVVNWKWEAN